MFKRLISVLTAAFLLPLLASCGGGAAMNGGDSGGVDRSSEIRTGTNVETEVQMSDFKEFAEEVTNDFIASDLAQNWKSQENKPKLMVGNLRNNTDNENIRMADIHDRINQTLVNSDIARVMGQGARDFDYVIRSELSSTTQYADDGTKLKQYRMQMNVYTPTGELKGQWSDNMSLKG